jgi:hypothetical protein
MTVVGVGVGVTLFLPPFLVLVVLIIGVCQKIF